MLFLVLSSFFPIETSRPSVQYTNKTQGVSDPLLLPLPLDILRLNDLQLQLQQALLYVTHGLYRELLVVLPELVIVLLKLKKVRLQVQLELGQLVQVVLQDPQVLPELEMVLIEQLSEVLGILIHALVLEQELAL